MAALAVALLSAGSVAGSDRPRGEIEARGAISFWAQELAAEGELLDPEGMAAHLVPLDDPGGEVVVPCGEPVVPEPGDYRFWLEGDGWISAAQGRVSHPEPGLGGRSSLVVAAVVRAGRVAFGAGTALGPDDELLLLHLESHNQLGSPQPEMLRRPRGELPADGVPMPAGPVVAAVHNRARAEYRWISAPFEVPAAGEVVVTPRPPSDGTDLVAVLDRPQEAASFDEYDVEPVLAIDGGSPLAPRVLVPTSERLYAIWYGIEGNLATLTVDSPSVHLPERQIPLRAGRVESYHGALRALPSLTVLLDLPPELELGDDPEVELLTFPERRPLRRQPLRPGERRFTFEKVPARSLEVALDLPPWRLMERPDLSDGLGLHSSDVLPPLVRRHALVSGEPDHRTDERLTTVAVDDPGGPVAGGDVEVELGVLGEVLAEGLGPGASVATAKLGHAGGRGRILDARRGRPPRPGGPPRLLRHSRPLPLEQHNPDRGRRVAPPSATPPPFLRIPR